jgi:hypothetical protein
MQNGYFEFLTFFVDLSDPRKDRGNNHNLLDMVALALCGTIAGANSWADIERFAKAHQEWFEEFLELPFGVPSHDTFGRVFARLDTEEFQHCLGRWVEHLQLQLEGQTVAIDGKTLRGSHDRSAGQQALHVVNAWANHVSFCLGQISVDSKANEIPAVRELLEILRGLAGCQLVSADVVEFGSPTTNGRENAGYGGLFWRGPRSFTEGVVLAPGFAGDAEEVRGERFEWLGVVGRHDGAAPGPEGGSAASTVLMVDPGTNPGGTPQWFVRASPFCCICPAPFFSTEVPFGAGETLVFEYAVIVAFSALSPCNGWTQRHTMPRGQWPSLRTVGRSASSTG